MSIIARKKDLVIQELENETLIYDLQNHKAYCLNETSALVWQNCDGTNSAADIARELEKTLGASVNEDMIWLALTQLEKEGLLEGQIIAASKKFEGLSRRDVIKRIGVTSMVALPVVASLVAPMAVHAQTCVQNAPGCFPNGAGTCTAPIQCCSCNCSPISPTMGNCTT